MRRWDVVVVGSGLAGAAAAARAAQEGADVLVVEGRSPAGRARTDERSGFRLNRGAHALYDAGPGRAVLERLGVSATGSPPPLDRAMGRRGDVVDRLPIRAAATVSTRLVSMRDKAQLARVLAGQRRWRPAELADRTIARWLDDDLGLTGGARALFAMLVRTATYTADHDRVSADVAASQVLAASAGVTYLDGGWGGLVDGLLDQARRAGASIQPGTVTAVEPLTGGGALVHTGHGVEAGQDVHAAATVVLAAGGPAAAARLLPERPAAWEGLGPVLAAACLDLGLDHTPPMAALFDLDRPLYLVRHAPPARLAPPGHALVHLLQYRSGDDPTPPDEARRQLADHARLAGIDPERAVVARFLHHMPVVTAAATPAGGGLAGRPGIASSGLPGVLVAGDWVGPDGHLADASLVSGEAAGAAAAQRARRAPVTTAVGPPLRP